MRVSEYREADYNQIANNEVVEFGVGGWGGDAATDN